MCGVDLKTTFTFRRKHKNLFPPSPSPESPRGTSFISYDEEDQEEESYLFTPRLIFSPSLNPSLGEEVPIVFRRPSQTSTERSEEDYYTLCPMVYVPEAPTREHKLSRSSLLQRTTQDRDIDTQTISMVMATTGSEGMNSGHISTNPPLTPILPPPALDRSTSLEAVKTRKRPSLPALSLLPPPHSAERASSVPRPLLLPPHISHSHSPSSPSTGIHPSLRPSLDIQPNGPPSAPTVSTPSNVTGLLTNVLDIMISIMDRRSEVSSEHELLGNLKELAITLQDDVEEVGRMGSLVEDYCGEIDEQVEEQKLESWVEELGSRMGGEDDEWEDEAARSESSDTLDSAVALETVESIFGSLSPRYEKRRQASLDANIGGGRRSGRSWKERSRSDAKPLPSLPRVGATWSQVNDTSPYRRARSENHGALAMLENGRDAGRSKKSPKFRDSGLDLQSPPGRDVKREQNGNPEWI